MLDQRQRDLIRFYEILAMLEEKVDCKKYLAECDGRMLWPERGVYFFFEAGEERSDSGEGLRVVRVGTHALKADSTTKLWNRLSQHRGTMKLGGGNHRGSIFRLLVGEAIKRRAEYQDVRTWGVGGDPSKAAQKFNMATKEVLQEEYPLEVMVSNHIRSMPFLWVGINDAPGPESDRGWIERNSIGLLSNFTRPALDPPSDGWLGAHCNHEKVRHSGLWNNNHVDEEYDPRFLDILERYVDGI